MAKKKKKSGLSSLYEDELGFGQTSKTKAEAYELMLAPYFKNDPLAHLGFKLIGGENIYKIIEPFYARKYKDFWAGHPSGGRVPRTKEDKMAKLITKLDSPEGAAIKLFSKDKKIREFVFGPDFDKKLKDEEVNPLRKILLMQQGDLGKNPKSDVPYIRYGMAGRPNIRWLDKGGKRETWTTDEDYQRAIAVLLHELRHPAILYLQRTGHIDEEEVKGLRSHLWPKDKKINDSEKMTILNPDLSGKKEKKEYGPNLDEKYRIIDSHALMRPLDLLHRLKYKHPEDPDMKESQVERMAEYKKRFKRSPTKDPLISQARYELDRFEKLKNLYKQLGSKE